MIKNNDAEKMAIILTGSSYCRVGTCDNCNGKLTCEEYQNHLSDCEQLVSEGYGNIKNLLLELADEYDDWEEKRFRDYEAFVKFAKKYGVRL